MRLEDEGLPVDAAGTLGVPADRAELDQARIVMLTFHRIAPQEGRDHSRPRQARARQDE